MSVDWDQPAEWELSRDPYYFAHRRQPPGPWLWSRSWTAESSSGTPVWGRAGTQRYGLNLLVVVALSAVCPVL